MSTTEPTDEMVEAARAAYATVQREQAAEQSGRFPNTVKRREENSATRWRAALRAALSVSSPPAPPEETEPIWGVIVSEATRAITQHIDGTTMTINAQAAIRDVLAVLEAAPDLVWLPDEEADVLAEEALNRAWNEGWEACEAELMRGSLTVSERGNPYPARRSPVAPSEGRRLSGCSERGHAGCEWVGEMHHHHPAPETKEEQNP